MRSMADFVKSEKELCYDKSMLGLIISLSTLLFAPSQAPTVFEGLGSHSFKTSTRSAPAQKFFDQGLCFLYAFNHDEAIRSFTAAAEADKEFAMAYWGIAMANGPHINNPVVDEDHAKAAWDAIQEAKKFSNQASRLEKDLIFATSKRYAMPQPEDRKPLDIAFANEMRSVWKRNYSNSDVGAIFAESMMDLRPWDLWKPDGKPQPGTLEIVRTLERVIQLNPTHPLALHLYILAFEASKNPEKALRAANQLRNLQPALGHMVHMPSHIDVRVGQWRESILANQKAIVADDNYRKIRPTQGFYSVYMAHNRHMLAFSGMMIGRSKISIKAIDEMIAKIPEEFLEYAAPLIDGYLVMPIEVRVRFGLWDEVLAAPEFSEKFPLSRTLRHAARCIAFAAKGDAKNARMEQALFYDSRTKVPADQTFGNNIAKDVLTTATHLMNGELLVAEKKYDSAVKHLTMAVKAEDQLRYDEPPDWIQPTRHTLGALLLKMNRLNDAVAVFKEDLKKLPNNGWSLYGISTAYKKMGKLKESEKFGQAFQTAWNGADITISSSCLCIPGSR